MKNIIQLETERLIIREIDINDKNDLFEMDSDPDVHKYIDQNPIKAIEQLSEIIQMIRNQYIENGIGRWALADKKTDEVIGWAGLKLIKEEMNNHKNFYELGYRLKQKHWGKGFTTEACKQIIDYAFNTMKLDVIYLIVDPENIKSKNVAKKLGFSFVELFDYEGRLIEWYEVK